DDRPPIPSIQKILAGLSDVKLAGILASAIEKLPTRLHRFVDIVPKRAFLKTGASPLRVLFRPARCHLHPVEVFISVGACMKTIEHECIRQDMNCVLLCES